MRSYGIVLSAFAAVAFVAAACDRDSSSSPFGIAGVPDAFAMNVSSRAAKPTIVLVHGGFADATGWQDLIPLLQQQHYPVVAVSTSTQP